MKAEMLLVTVLLTLAVTLFSGVLFFMILKYIKRTHFPAWKFPDYVSVGYAEYLYNKYVRKSVK